MSRSNCQRTRYPSPAANLPAVLAWTLRPSAHWRFFAAAVKQNVSLEQPLRLSNLLLGADYMMLEPPNTAYSCGQHGPATAWIRSARPGNLFQKHLLCWEQKYIVYRNGIASVKVTFCVLSEFLLLNTELLQRNCWVLRVTKQCFWNIQKTFGAACAVFPPWPAWFLTPALQAIKLSFEGGTWRPGLTAKLPIVQVYNHKAIRCSGVVAKLTELSFPIYYSSYHSILFNVNYR